MRDLNASFALAARLTTVLRDNPNLRLGQLITNAVDNTEDIYYWDDERLLVKLEEYSRLSQASRITVGGDF